MLLFMLDDLLGTSFNYALTFVNSVSLSNPHECSIITKKMVVKALLSRLSLPGDHFDKEQRNTIASTAKQVLVKPHLLFAIP